MIQVGGDGGLEQSCKAEVVRSVCSLGVSEDLAKTVCWWFGWDMRKQSGVTLRWRRQ